MAKKHNPLITELVSRMDTYLQNAEIYSEKSETHIQYETSKKDCIDRFIKDGRKLMELIGKEFRDGNK